MRKKLLTIAVVSAILLSCAGCSNRMAEAGIRITPALPEALILSVSDGLADAEIPIEYYIEDRETYQGITPEESRTFVVNGKEITARYTESQFILYNTYPVFIYEAEEGRQTIGIDPEGNIADWFDLKSENGESVSKKSKEECLQIALKFLQPFVDTALYQTEITEKEDAYAVEFIKYVDEYKTTDSATVTVCKDGTIRSFVPCMLGRIDPERHAGYEKDIVCDAAVKKASLLLQNEGDDNSKNEISIRSVLFTITKDNRTAYIVTVKNSKRTQQGEYDLLGGWLMQMIVIEE